MTIAMQRRSRKPCSGQRWNFVSIKAPQQSHRLSLHRVRSRRVGQRASSVLNFTTLDIQPGDWLKIGSQVASAGFATAGPNDWVRISAVTAKRILLGIVPAGWIAERAQVAAPLTYAPAIPFSAAGIRVCTVSVAISLSPTSHARRS
jgi:hypothetical protein